MTDYQLEELEWNDDDNMYTSKVNGQELISEPIKIIKFDSSKITFEFTQWSNNFYQRINNLELGIKNKIIESSDILFGESVNPDNINDMFATSVKLPESVPNLPTITLNYNNNLKIYDRGNKLMELNNLKNNMTVEIKFYPDHVRFHRSSCNIQYIVIEIYVLWNDSKNL